MLYMRVLLIIIYIFIIILFIKNKNPSKLEGFCEKNEESHICRFMVVELPIQDEFTEPEIKNYNRDQAENVYNILFNTNNPKLSYNNYLKNEGGMKIVDTTKYIINFSINEFLLELCYINKPEEIEGIITVLNDFLKEKYIDINDNFILVKSTDTVKNYFSKLIQIRYSYLNKIFDEQNEIETDSLNIEIIKENIFYLLLEESNEIYINSNLRLGVYLYLYDKNIFIISKDTDNNIYQKLLVIIMDTIKIYINNIFNIVLEDIEILSIKEVKNLILNGKIIDYFLLKKDLCYI